MYSERGLSFGRKSSGLGLRGARQFLIIEYMDDLPVSCFLDVS